MTMLSCGASFGERLTYGNLSIYYTPRNVGIEYAQRLGQYFESNELIQDKQHAIQLTSDSKGFILRMVLNDNYEQLPEDQERNLMDCSTGTVYLKESAFMRGASTS